MCIRDSTKGPYKGHRLNPDGYGRILSWYYEARGWDERGVPRKSTLERLGLSDVASTLSEVVSLKG